MLVEGPTLARALNNPEKTALIVFLPSWATDTNEAGEKRRFTRVEIGGIPAQGAPTCHCRKTLQKLHGQRVSYEIETLDRDVDIQLAVVYVTKAGYAQGKLLSRSSVSAGANHRSTRASTGTCIRTAHHRPRQRIGKFCRSPSLAQRESPPVSSASLIARRLLSGSSEYRGGPQFTIVTEMREDVDPSSANSLNETETPRGSLELALNTSCAPSTCNEPCKKGRVVTVQASLPHFYS